MPPIQYKLKLVTLPPSFMMLTVDVVIFPDITPLPVVLRTITTEKDSSLSMKPSSVIVTLRHLIVPLPEPAENTGVVDAER
jgi:hypothetical protein